ncbi:hypothetical protein FAM09_01375 [Niastella caeni]|uniref:Uncharacterized protein n=1 Tax=Niastella caeni TaxID=2569763 RepID=A0A4S8HZH7_9BACT|nr:hypothetical protein [Niastella caeni]THU40791.1 hypothetical protein FAM09_01375 [Niastella caeni]
MNRVIYFLICIIPLTISCSRKDAAPDNTKQVYEWLHGKYKAISSFSSEAVDVNMDGVATDNILTEIPDLTHCRLEIRIVSQNNFLFAESWPEQFIGHGIEPPGYDPSLAVNYVRQGLVRTFSLDNTSNKILVNPDTTPLPDTRRFSFPLAVTVEGSDTIKVVISKKLYTSAGWKVVTITTVYERYTMIT